MLQIYLIELRNSCIILLKKIPRPGYYKSGKTRLWKEKKPISHWENEKTYIWHWYARACCYLKTR